MKKIILYFVFIFILFCFLNIVNASLFNNIENTNPYEQSCKNNNCLKEWIESIKKIKWLETNRKASVYIQDITIYILWFIFLIAVLYIIYAWFIILTAAWDDEQTKKWKTIIIYTIVWIIIIFIAWPIIKFVLNILTKQ